MTAARRRSTPDAARGEEDFAAFRANLERGGVQERVRHLRLPSDAALHQLEGEIDLLYVDGAHRYRPARADIEQWGARVVPGGGLLVHDSFNAIGVMLAQLRLLVFSRGWRYRGRHGSLAVYRREPLDTAAMAVNAGRQLAGLAVLRAQHVREGGAGGSREAGGPAAGPWRRALALLNSAP